MWGGGGGDIHPCTFNCFTSVTCGQPHALAALPQGKNPRYPLNMRLSDSQSRSGPFEEREGFTSCRELNNVFCVVRHLAYPYTN
jgi:hypothetical protein